MQNGVRLGSGLLASASGHVRRGMWDPSPDDASESPEFTSKYCTMICVGSQYAALHRDSEGACRFLIIMKLFL